MLEKKLESLKKELESVILNFKKELLKYSLNKINISILEDIKINYIGSIYKLNQISVINIENQNILIKPFDKSIANNICNEIIKLNMDLNPFVTDDLIKITYPKTTMERRLFFIKKIKELTENYKINIRNIRRTENSKIKLMSKNKDISQDDEKKTLSTIQINVDKTIEQIELFQEKKINELSKL